MNVCIIFTCLILHILFFCISSTSSYPNSFAPEYRSLHQHLSHCLLLPTAFPVTCSTDHYCWISIPVPVVSHTLLFLSLTRDLETGKIQQPPHSCQLHQKSQRGERLFHILRTKPLVANCRSKLSSFYIEVLHLGFWNLNKWHGTNTMFRFVLYVICPSSTVLLFWNKNIPGVNCIDRKVCIYEFHL